MPHINQTVINVQHVKNLVSYDQYPTTKCMPWPIIDVLKMAPLGLVFKKPAEEKENTDVDSYQIHNMVHSLSLLPWPWQDGLDN